MHERVPCANVSSAADLQCSINPGGKDTCLMPADRSSYDDTSHTLPESATLDSGLIDWATSRLSFQVAACSRATYWLVSTP